jgi:hypothetical protein
VPSGTCWIIAPSQLLLQDWEAGMKASPVSIATAPSQLLLQDWEAGMKGKHTLSFFFSLPAGHVPVYTVCRPKYVAPGGVWENGHLPPRPLLPIALDLQLLLQRGSL